LPLWRSSKVENTLSAMTEPLTAIEDALAGQQFDELIISTLPSGISHWLRMDLPQRAERKFKLPVTTITTRH
jgi:hypothetical protein